MNGFFVLYCDHLETFTTAAEARARAEEILALVNADRARAGLTGPRDEHASLRWGAFTGVASISGATVSLVAP